MLTDTVEDTFEPTWWRATQRTPEGTLTTYVIGDADELIWARAAGGPLADIDDVDGIEDADLLRRLGESVSGDVDGIPVFELSSAIEYERGWSRG